MPYNVSDFYSARQQSGGALSKADVRLFVCLSRAPVLETVHFRIAVIVEEKIETPCGKSNIHTNQKLW